ncbi:MAG: hypothetical protein KTR24_12320 [Saprospiraceae bacterium]|nr:hypothetical protein [Saprospiraceae bacterium]
MKVKAKREHIDAIYPLTSLQQALLIHHLSADADQGQLTVTFDIHGPLDVPRFREAWKLITVRHEVLRSTIHHEKLKSPVRIVHKEITPEISISMPTDQNLKLAKAPVDKIYLEQTSSLHTHVTWVCHHILLDGWSTSIIMRDLCLAYQALESDNELTWPALPSYKSWLQWRKSQPPQEVDFWNEVEDANRAPRLFTRSSGGAASYSECTVPLPPEFMESCSIMSINAGTTQSIWMQAVWSCVLSAWYESGSFQFGLTRSGRNIDFPGIDLMAGLFVSEVPVLVDIQESSLFADLLEKLHSFNLKINDLEQYGGVYQEDPGNLESHVESMLTIENIPASELRTDTLKMSTFSSGITSTHPLSLVMIPGDQPSLTIHHRLDFVSEEEAQSILDAVIEIGRGAGVSGASVEDLARHVPSLSTLGGSSLEQEPKNGQAIYAQPEHEVHLKLVMMFEELLALSPIGIDHHFFENGGSSLQALRLLARIEKEWGKSVSPGVFLQDPTVRSISKYLSDDTEASSWSSLVPLRAKGQKPPIFCVHAGGAHVFFYQPLARHLGEDQPVFGIQPQGLNGEVEMHSTIEEMARHYWSEIQSVQEEGPWTLLGYCFSAPVCVEMAKVIRAEGGEANVIIVDSGPWFEDGTEQSSLGEQIAKLITIIGNRNWKRLRDIIEEKTKKIRGKYLSRLENEQSAHLLRMEQALRGVYYRYDWQPFDGKVILVRSSEFAKRPDKEFHLEEWSDLAQGGLDVIVVDAKHKTIFEDPDAVQLASGIADYLEQR